MKPIKVRYPKSNPEPYMWIDTLIHGTSYVAILVDKDGYVHLGNISDICVENPIETFEGFKFFSK